MAAINSVRAFRAIVYNEVLLNSKRVAPYVMALLCAGNGLLWWGWGPASGRGWAVNADFFIAGALPVYSFMTLPLFTALFMADPISRDFRFGIDPLIFSKPLSRATYLLGKFFGNFFVLVCCQSAFVLTWFLLQGVHKQGVITQDVKVVPYFKHFFVFVVISHLLLASLYFAVGVLTRNPKIVYGLGVSFYPVYIAFQTVLLSSLPWRWKLALDPLLMNRGRGNATASAEWLNQLVIVYDTDLIVNRVVMLALTTICLTFLYSRFTTAERSANVEKFSFLNLSTTSQRIYYPDRALDVFDKHVPVAIPVVERLNEGVRARVNKLIGAIAVEFRLLAAERSLVVVMPLAVFLSVLEVAFYNIPPDVSQSAAYATNTARLLLLFLIGVAVFYTGEAMHRDREVKIEPVIWSTPVPNSVLLLSKFLVTILLTFSLLAAVGVIAILVQLLRGHTPIDVSAYLLVYGVVLVPGIIFVTAMVMALNVLLRNKYLVYVVAVGLGAGLFYLYSAGYNHWLYNPLLYQFWHYPDLTTAKMFGYRLYWLIVAAVCLALAHRLFERRST